MKIISILVVLISFIACEQTQEVKKGSLDNDVKIVEKKGDLKNDMKLILKDEEDCDDKAEKALEVKVDDKGDISLAPEGEEGCTLEE